MCLEVLGEGLTNCGCLHCAILKALHGFQEKRAHKSRHVQFFLRNVENEIFKVFKVLCFLFHLESSPHFCVEILAMYKKRLD